jgi:UDP-N-acetylmuramyl pentapeptide synthase
MKNAASVLEEKNIPFFFTEEMEKLSHAAKECIHGGDLILLKGSRGCALEQLNEIVLMEEKNVS